MKYFLNIFVLLCFFTAGAHTPDLRSDTIDVRTYYLKIDLSDFTNKILRGEARLGIKSKMNGVQGIRLDLLKLTVDSVRVDYYQVPFTHNDTLLDINLLTTLNTGDSITVTVFYRGKPLQVSGDFGGFYWNNMYAFNIGVSFLSEPHNYGRVWFPCIDNFRQRSYYEFEITTKNIHKAFCNGVLISETNAGPNKVWRWKLHQPIPTYLASVAVSQYETVKDTVQGLQGVKEIILAARASDTFSMKNLFVHLPDAFHLYEELFGPYQWDRVGYCIVPFSAGAMEHATNIAFMQLYLNLASAYCEESMAHELSHHWFGNLVTCDSASEMWLNEGWARYCEKLFLERLYGDSVYRQSMRTMHEDILRRTHLRDGGYYPVSGVPSAKTYSSTVYDKGADVIHTLRWYMGDSMFFKCIKSYLNAYQWSTVSTANLRDYLMQCSGYNLQDYFNDWVYQKGFTHFSIENLTINTTGADAEYATFNIRQRLLQADHYYRAVPVKITYVSRAGLPLHNETVWVSGECTGHRSPDLSSFQGIGMVVLDMDEKLQDAITDYYYRITSDGNYDFKVARASLHISSVTQPVLVRAEHHWIHPEPMQNKIPGVRLNPRRHWTIDASQPLSTGQQFVARLTFPYDGTDPGLDKDFITQPEDSLLIFYRPNAEADWQPADSFYVDMKNNNTDKKGEIIVYNARKGQYAMGIRLGAYTDTSGVFTDCPYQFSATQNVHAGESIHIYPNPADDVLHLRMPPYTFNKIVIHDITGKMIWTGNLTYPEQNLTLDTHAWASGLYFVTWQCPGVNHTYKIWIQRDAP
ncbi:MAG: M1 family aminopeptidase [Chitinophagales bacterium]|nr:M1 family aminopeptidase [Chitinophagales bacterium]MDW8419360.1 M1 family aminopeptidase [Chitinophagales bacterium]